jgi:hypothetical protein
MAPLDVGTLLPKSLLLVGSPQSRYRCDARESSAELSDIELMIPEYLDKEDQHQNDKNWA